MKKFLFNVFGAFSLLAINPMNSQAQCFKGADGAYYDGTGKPCTNTVISAVPFLRIASDARSGAMGDAGIAISGDANAMHFNPSKLVFAKEDLGVSATYTPWLRALGVSDIYLAYLTGYKQINKRQAVGVGLRYFSMGSIEYTNEAGETTGMGSPNEFELNAAFAQKLSPKLSVGLSGKFIYSNLATGQQVGLIPIKAGKAGAADISLTYRTPIKTAKGDNEFMAGIAITNIGSKISYTNSVYRDYLPANMGIGAAYTMKLNDYNTMTFTSDINKLLVPTPYLRTDVEHYDVEPKDGIPDFKQKSTVGAIFSSFSDAPGGASEKLKELMYSVGMEYWYDKQFAVRAGYYTEHKTKGNRKYLTLGLGLKYNIFGLNFSYLVPVTSQRNPLDNTLRFSLLFDFNAFKGEADPDEE